MDTKLNIIIDTREQTPWSFPEWAANVQIGTLPAGDYALAGDERFSIERKSLDDFLGTISSGWERFKRELDRMKDYPARIIIVEGDFKRCCFISENGKIIPPMHNHFHLLPQFINSRIGELSIMGVSVLFAGNPQYASALALSIFKHRQIGLLNANTCNN